MIIRPPNYLHCPFDGSLLKTRVEESDKERNYCPVCKWKYYPTVCYSATGLIVKNNKVLMAKRRNFPHAGKWVFPAGFAEYGEHPGEALAREIEEELNVKISDASIIDIYQSTDDIRALGHLIVAYLVTVIGTPKNNDPEENSIIGWHNIKGAPPEIAFEIHREKLWPWLQSNTR